MTKVEVEASGGVTDILKFRGSTDNMGVLTIFDAEKKKLKVVGVIEGIRVGDNIEVIGYETEHPHYGRQVRATRIVTTLPQHRNALAEWLIRHFGLGWKDAPALVDEWLRDYTTIGVASVSTAIALIGKGDQEIIRFWNNLVVDEPAMRLLFERNKSGDQYRDVQQYVLRKATIDTLVRMGLETREAFSLYTLRGAKSVQELKDDPYVAYYYLENTPFAKIDKIYLEQPGRKKSDDRRVAATCLYEMRACVEEGHTAMYYDDFLELIEELHPEFSATKLISNIQSLMGTFLSLYGNPMMVQLSEYARFEAGVAEFVNFGTVKTLPPNMEADI